jgi:TRAP-type mannitol/chloroaromatic compound transport system permease large subunit
MSDYLSLLMFPALLFALFLGFPVAFSMMGVALMFGLIVFGDAVIFQFVQKVNDVASNYVLAAVPLFVFMGAMLERSGIAERLFEAVHLWTRRLPGGLALGTIIMCVIFAASTGVIGATETVVGLLAIPVMMKYAYDKGLISGTICAGGSLGTIIPPSVVVVVLGPVADVSVGDLFVGMIFPGLLMAALYLLYILVRCSLDPTAGPRLPRQDDEPSLLGKLRISVTALLPPVLMIFAVLGSIMFGWARRLHAWRALGSVGHDAQGYLHDHADPLGRQYVRRGLCRWRGCGVGQRPDTDSAAERLGHVGRSFGFDPVWFCILFLIVIQTSYLTPPMAPAIFYLRGISPPEITLRTMFRGVVPFIVLQLITLAIVAAFPQIVLWLPSQLLGFR